MTMLEPYLTACVPGILALVVGSVGLRVALGAPTGQPKDTPRARAWTVGSLLMVSGLLVWVTVVVVKGG